MMVRLSRPGAQNRKALSPFGTPTTMLNRCPDLDRMGLTINNKN
jgi:hypothetical protein